ncbi:acetylglutamate kinase [Campylobacter corcagiensis]|uniref:Acetylglutamate kinase n=1 Tax=Campylobacter corcagiensis TaxID=1448857 RepID=A0A7M1LEG5_9BACT|nr:acetylglutamate kinase [Campylobacter corcagiensis]QKF64868.1 acetylglutamate kinase [Campylobacter corcagiensis]QOQ86972.1 acetylglutamate kinase [Campylobacter corcagiensis]
MQRKSRTAEIILSALPYIRKFKDKVFVIKYGGSAQIDEELKNDFARDIVLLSMVGIKVIVVHGGGKKINEYLERLNIKSEFKDGLRVTNKDAIDTVEMVLSGLINKEITALLFKHGTKAVGLSGKDSELLQATVLGGGKYGFVGEIHSVNIELLNSLMNQEYIPVIAPIGVGLEGESYNINADLCASAVAKALKADKVIFLTDTSGVLDKNSELISKLDENLINELKQNGTISGGMIPKVDACLECVKAGVKNAHIIDGRISHSILLEIFTDSGIGSIIKGQI